MTGPGLEALAQVAALGFRVQASGGLRDLADLALMAAVPGTRVRHLRQGPAGRAHDAGGPGGAGGHGRPGRSCLMAAKRIIPCLDVKDARVVKGINFKGLRDMGHPAEMGVRYGREGADELVFLDIVASEEGRTTREAWVRGSGRHPEHPLHRGRRRRQRGGHPPPAAGRGRQGGPEHRRHRRPAPGDPGRRRLRPPVRGGGGGRGPGPGPGLAGVRQGRQRAHRAGRRRLAARAGGPGRRARSCSPPSTGTAPSRASTWTSWTWPPACPSR